MQQLMSYLLWWRGTPRPLTGQDRTNRRMHSVWRHFVARSCLHSSLATAEYWRRGPRCCRECHATARHLGARPVPHKAPAASAFACNIRPCSVTPRYGELRRTSPPQPPSPPHSAAPPSFAHQMICQLSNVAFHILTELLFECEHPVILLLISSVVLCWSIQEL